MFGLGDQTLPKGADATSTAIVPFQLGSGCPGTTSAGAHGGGAVQRELPCLLHLRGERSAKEPRGVLHQEAHTWPTQEPVT